MNTETNTADVPAHCKIGPSTLPARAICPCHESAAGGPDAQSGTRAHKVVELCLKHESEVSPVAFGPEVTDDERQRGMWGARTIRALRDETAPGQNVVAEFRAEFRPNFLMDRPVERDLIRGKFGTCDAHWESADGRTLNVCDFKTYAKGDGEKDYAPQLMFYAVLLASEYGHHYNDVNGYIVAAGDYTVQRVHFTLEDAIARVAWLIRRIQALQPGVVMDRAEDILATFGHPSVWCSTCKHAADCPAISKAIQLVEGGGILTRPLAIQKAVVPILEAYIKRVNAEVRAVLEGGGRVLDTGTGIEFGWAERKGRAKLKDLRGLVCSMTEYGVKPENIAAAVSISKSAVDALLKDAEGDRYEGWKEKDKKVARAAVFEPFFTEPGVERYIKRLS